MSDEQKVVEPQPGSPEYDAAMAAKFDAAQAASVEPESQPELPQRPEYVPEKFWDAKTGQVNMEAWAKSYSELEKKLSQSKAPEAPKPEGTEQAPQQDDAEKALEARGLSMDAFTQEFAENGALSEDSYAKLEAAGIPRAMVDAYIDGQKALAEKAVQVAYEAAGGEEQWKLMAEWAKTGLSAEERALFNKTVERATADELRFAIAGLRARYEAANGKEPGLVGGDKGSAPVGFRSTAELTAAIRDPRYAKDPAYRKDVERKIAAATFW